MIKNKNLDWIWSFFGKEDNKKVFDMFLEIANNKSLDNKVRSEGYRGAGEVIFCLSCSLGNQDSGYSYFKQAIDLDENNLKARISICFLFFDPEGQGFINEKEFLENILYLLNFDFNKINDMYSEKEIKIIKDELQKLIKSYFKKRLEILK